MTSPARTGSDRPSTGASDDAARRDEVRRRAALGWSLRRPRTRAEALGTVEQELAAERAATLGRITMSLADAVSTWHRMANDRSATFEDREDAIDQVSRAAWHVIVQRESLGLQGDHLAWMQEVHDVPPAALARLGTRRVLVQDSDAFERVGQQGIPSLRHHALWSRRGG